MHQLLGFLRSLVMFILAALAPFIVIVLGGVVVGAGIYMQFEWLMYGGAFLCVLGIVWVGRFWFDMD